MTVQPRATRPDAPARPPLLALAALAAVTFWLYLPTARHGFVAFDDPVYVTENETVARGLTLAGARWAFGFHAGNWHPLTWLSHMLDVELFGLAAGGHHLVSAGLHALDALLLAWLVTRMSGARWTALLVAALFALHPLRVESVAWASERKDVLAGTFWMLALLAHERYARRGGARRYALVAVCLALGLMAKSMLVTLPVVMLVLDSWPLGRLRGRTPPESPAVPSLAPDSSGACGAGRHPGTGNREGPGSVPSGFTPFLEKLALLALALAAGSATLWIQQSEGAVGGLRSLTWIERSANALLSYGTYVAQTFWPADLACIVLHPVVVAPREELARALFWPGAACGLAILLLTALAWRARRSRPHLLAGWLWYLISAAPVIGFVQVGQQGHADRYTYLPTIGIALALAFELRALVLRWPGLRPPVVAAALLALAALVPLTRRQVGTWMDSRTLFEHALAVTERNYVAATYLGQVERRSGELAAARGHLEAALEANKAHVPAILELGLVLEELGDLPGARRMLKRALRNDPASLPARRALERVERRLGDAPSSGDD